MTKTQENVLALFDAMKRDWQDKHEQGICFVCAKPYSKCKCGKVKGKCGHK